MPRNTYVTGLRAALAIAEKRAEVCEAEAKLHEAGREHFNPEQNAMWAKLERQCFIEDFFDTAQPAGGQHDD